MINYDSVLKKICSVFNEGRFRNIKGQKVSFFEYCKLRDFEREHKGDEDIVVTPILLELLKIFDFRSGVNILQQEIKDGDKPDFRTIETNKFILDAKSTGVDILSSRDEKSAVQQIVRYIESFKGYEYGILFNLKHFEFFERQIEMDTIKIIRLEDRSINLVELIKNFSDNKAEGTHDFENFKWFYDNFKFEKISPEEYVEIIKNRKKEDLIIPDKKLLKTLVYGMIFKIQDNVRRQVMPLVKDMDHHIRMKFELNKIIREINVSEETEKYSIAAEELIKQISYVILLKFILMKPAWRTRIP